MYVLCSWFVVAGVTGVGGAEQGGAAGGAGGDGGAPAQGGSRQGKQYNTVIPTLFP